MFILTNPSLLCLYFFLFGGFIRITTFFVQSRLVSSTHDGRITVDILDYKTLVHISSFQPEDRGQWQCLATNIAGTATARTTIQMVPGTPCDMHIELIYIIEQAH